MADIGIHPHEIGRRQRLIVSATIETEPPRDDRIGDAFDYSLVPHVVEMLARDHVGLIETFARRVAEACLESAMAFRVHVRVEKPDALSKGLAWVEITLDAQGR